MAISEFYGEMSLTSLTVSSQTGMKVTTVTSTLGVSLTSLTSPKTISSMFPLFAIDTASSQLTKLELISSTFSNV